MAQDIQGMLVRIEATTAQLRQEMKRADAAVANATKGIDKELSLVDKAFERMGLSAEKSKRVAVSAMKNIGTAIGAAAAAGAAGLATLVVKTAESAREIQNMSRVANASTTEFQRYAAGAKTVGVEQDKLADILKDVNDRVGDFLSTGGGEMKDFFENIAPRIGVTAEQFRKLSGPQALQLFYSSLEKANLSQAEMTFYMEAMANDTTALIPLLKNGGAGFKEMGDQAQAMGAVLSDLEIKQLEEFTRSTDEMKLAFRGASNQITTDLLPTIKDLTGLLKDPATVDAARVMASGVGQALVYIVERSVDAINWMRRLKGEIADNDIALLEAEIKRVTGMLDGSVLDRTILFGRDGVVEYYDDDELNAELVKLVVAVNKAKAEAAKGPVKIDIETPKLDGLPPLLKTTATSATGAAEAIKKVDKALKDIDADGPGKAIAEYQKQFDDLHDSLNPAEVAAREYGKQQDLLNDIIARGGESADKARGDLVKLKEQYEENNRETSQWAQLTEDAFERVSERGADMWEGFSESGKFSFDSLLDVARRWAAEMANAVTIKPLLTSLGNAVMGTNNQGGIGQVWGSLLGGSSGSGGGTDMLGTLNQARSLYSTIGTAQSLWPALSGGYASGGFGGALNAGASAIGGMFGLGSGAAASMAAGSTAAGYTGAAYASWAAAQGAAGAGAAAAGAGGLGAGMMAKIGAMASNPVGWFIAAITGMYQSGKLFDAGVRISGDRTGDYDDDASLLGRTAWAPFRVAGTAIEKMDKLIASVVGDKTAAMITGSPITQFVMDKLGAGLFGGQWQTKDMGIGLGVEGGAFGVEQYESQKKKGGWFKSDKKRTLWSELDPETAAALQQTYDTTKAGVSSIFESLSLTLDEGSLAGLQLAREKISTNGKTEEEIQEAVSEWFLSLSEAMNTELNKVFGTGLDYDLAGMQAFVGNLKGVNEVIRYLNVDMYDMTVAGGKLAESLSAASGGLDALANNSQTYYGAFFTDAEKVEDTIDSIKRAFESADVELAASREAYRAMVEDIDLTSEAGQQMFATMMALSGQAAQYFSIVEQQAAQKAAEAAALLMGSVNTAYASLQRSIAAQQREIQQAATSTAANINVLTGVSNSLDAALRKLRGTSDDTVRMLRAQATMTLQGALVTARAGGSLADYAGLQDALDVASNMDTALYGSLEQFEREQGRTANLVAELEKVNGKQLTAEEQMLEQYEKQLSALDQQLAFAQAQLDALNGIDNSVKSVEAAIAAMNGAVVAALAGMADGLASKNTAGNNAALIDSVYQSVLGRKTDDAGAAFWQQQLASGNLDYDQLAKAIANDASKNANDPGAGSAADYLSNQGGLSVQDQVEAAYRATLGRSADSAGESYWMDQISSGGMSVAEMIAAIERDAKINGEIPGFASGGFTGYGDKFDPAGIVHKGEVVWSQSDIAKWGGVGAVEAMRQGGPELEVTGPSRIYNASQTAAMMGSGGSTEELRALRAEVSGLRSALGAIAKYTESTAYGVRQMNEIGLPQGEAA